MAVINTSSSDLPTVIIEATSPTAKLVADVTGMVVPLEVRNPLRVVLGLAIIPCADESERELRKLENHSLPSAVPPKICPI